MDSAGVKPGSEGEDSDGGESDGGESDEGVGISRQRRVN